MTTTSREPKAHVNPNAARERLLVALPEPGLSMTQDAEWCVVKLNGDWQQVRFHDYDDLYSVPGLYEKIIYDVLKCDSPRVVCRLLRQELDATQTPPEKLRVLDLGAGNGMVGEELAKQGVAFMVGVDIIDEALAGAERDRPGLYDGYHVVDMTDLDDDERKKMASYRFNALTCVAALGFGDIPPKAFTTAYNMVEPGGWIAFNIKEDFLSSNDPTGFAGLMRSMVDDGTLELRQQERYQHRLATNGDPLHYLALIGIKKRDVDDSCLRD